MGPCLPNPCNDGAVCISLQGQAYCRCTDEKEFYILGSKPSCGRSSESTAITSNHITNDNNACLPGICGDDVTCLVLLGIPYCECPNGAIVEQGKSDCSTPTTTTTTTLSTKSVETVKQLDDGHHMEHTNAQQSTSVHNNSTSSCLPNPCSDGASCMVAHGEVRCGCPATSSSFSSSSNVSSSVPLGVPCPASYIVAYSEDYPDPAIANPFYYVLFVLIGLFFMGCLLMYKFIEATNASNKTSASSSRRRNKPRRPWKTIQEDECVSSFQEDSLRRDESCWTVEGSFRTISTTRTTNEDIVPA